MNLTMSPEALPQATSHHAQAHQEKSEACCHSLHPTNKGERMNIYQNEVWPLHSIGKPRPSHWSLCFISRYRMMPYDQWVSISFQEEIIKAHQTQRRHHQEKRERLLDPNKEIHLHLISYLVEREEEPVQQWHLWSMNIKLLQQHELAA